MLTYGFGADNDVVCTPLDVPGTNAFSVRLPDGTCEQVHLDHNPGLHNCLNASAVLTLAYVLGLPCDKAAQAISSFAGVHRRFELVGEVEGVRVIDDYGHHPTEIAATLKAAKTQGFERVRVVFQPHRYSRTQALADEFGPAFDDADELVVLDVFSAGETPIPGISGKTVVKAVQARRPGAQASFIPDRHQAVEHMVRTARPGDLIVTMGAGDVTVLGPALIEALKEKAAHA